MKKLLLLSLATIVWASDYTFLHYYKNYAAAREKALSDNKLLMLVVVRDHCSWCHKLADTTLKDAKIQQKVYSDYVPLILNTTHDALPLPFQSPVLPTIYFIDPKGDCEIFRGKGYYSVNAFLQLMNQAWQSHLADLLDAKETE